jgi:histone acetyltransferase (RNA polymerase elongator complex component)
LSSLKKRKQLIIPVFIPHEGCPYRCAFCNQSKITGVNQQSDEIIVSQTIQSYLDVFDSESLPEKREVAFYGGSFTGLPEERQKQLLYAVQPSIKSGEVHSIRVSTHSLLVNPSNISLLKDKNVKTVELGIQSTNDRVLQAVGRPCDFQTVISAVDSIRKEGLRLGLQLMPGLPDDDETIFMKSVKDVIGLKPDFVRIYPTLVIKNTNLYEMYKLGEYLPWKLNRMVRLVKDALLAFQNDNISVIRVGLHSDPSMLENFVDGPYHPAFRYLVDSLIAREKMFNLIDKLQRVPKTLTFKVPSRQVSLYLGHKKDNIQAIQNRYGINTILIQQIDDQEFLQLVA